MKKKNESEKNISSSSEMNPCKNSLIYYLESENKLEMLCFLIKLTREI